MHSFLQLYRKSRENVALAANVTLKTADQRFLASSSLFAMPQGKATEVWNVNICL